MRNFISWNPIMYYIHGRRLRGGLVGRSPKKSLGGGRPCIRTPIFLEAVRDSERTNYELCKKEVSSRNFFFRSRRFLVKKGPYTCIRYVSYYIVIYNIRDRENLKKHGR